MECLPQSNTSKCIERREKMIKIEKPEIAGCYKHERKFNEECSVCIELNKTRQNRFKEEVNAVTYKLVYDNWTNYLNSVMPEVREGTNAEKRVTKLHYVKLATKAITKDLYPFEEKKGYWKSSWKKAIKELSLKLEDSYIPVGRDKTGKSIDLWF
jgi:hypothetical protein